MKKLFALILVLAFQRHLCAQTAPDIHWLSSLDAAYIQAQRGNQPILVFVGDRADLATTREFNLLQASLTPPMQQAFVLAHLEAVDSRDAVQYLGVSNLPALRIVTPDGRIIARREAGETQPAIADWLAAALKTQSPIASTRDQFINDLASQDSSARERAVRQLITDRAAAPQVVPLLFDRKLSTSLEAFNLLEQWNAPLDGIDPWHPDTLTAQRRAALKLWAESTASTAPSSRPLSADDIGVWLDAMLAAPTDAEARAMREPLIRFGDQILPLVEARLASATDDNSRQRLRAMRYRLVATDRLAAQWPGGFDRLASADPFIRRAAVDELANHAGGDDARILLTLFSDPDPFLRERSLRILGGLHVAQSNSALIQLLSDTEPNVRAAVLRTFAESLDGTNSTDEPDVISGLVHCVQSEKNVDLVVQCIRVLQKVKGNEPVDCIQALLNHPQWRVRAEAADAIHMDLQAREKFDAARSASLIAALVPHLDDSDAFVTSQSAIALVNFNDKTANDAVLKALDRHPGLVTDLMGQTRLDHALAIMLIPAVHKLLSSSEPRTRISAISLICRLSPQSAGDAITAGLADSDPDVRQAAMTGFAGALMAGFPVDGTLYAIPGDYSSTRTNVNVAEWAEKFVAGTGRPAWMSPLSPKVLPLLESPDEQTRVAAAVCLCALGDSEHAWPILLKSADSEMTRATEPNALPWLPWEKRLELFNRLVPITPDGQMANLARWFGAIPDKRAAAPLWQLLADSHRDKLLQPVVSALQATVSRSQNNGDSVPPATPPELTDKMLHTGSELQKVAALYLLFQTNNADASVTARAIALDKSNSDTLRDDAFHIFVFGGDSAANQSTVVAAIADPVLKGAAVQYLAGAYEGQPYQLRGQIYMYSNSSSVSYGNGTIIAVQAPFGVSADVLSPLLSDSDPQIAASAGYLLATLGDHRGFDLLLKYARGKNLDQEPWRSLVYRAIAKLDDDSQTPVLEEIYKTYQKSDTYNVRQFYWTIRAMHGANILKLRQTIRDEVGTTNLM